MTGPDVTTTTSLSDKLSLVTHHHLLTRVPVKLDFEDWNYGSWEFFFYQLYFSYDVSKYIHGDANENSFSSSTPLTPEELKVDKIILSWIFSTLSDVLQKRLVVARPKPDLKTARSLLITEEMRLKSKALSLPVDSFYPMVLMANSVNNRTSSTTPQVKSWRPCFNFAKGTCLFGESCRFVHDLNARLGTSNRGRGNGDNTTNELLNKLIQQLGNITCTSTVPSSTNNASSAVAFNTGPSPTGQATTIPYAFSTETLRDPNNGAWNMDTGASSHLNSSSACLSNVFNTCLYSSVSVGDGHPIPVTNSGHSILPTPNGSHHLGNVLITPSIVKNLIFVRQFVRDNNCTIEFDAFGFSVKDFTTRRVLLRCDGTGDLYPVTSPFLVPQAYLVSQHTWHQRLGHP
nr:ribonuclease H-like domain-containing protein [Tanacetum cinerariifolium]